jgi:hypothetical protein
VWGLVEAPTAHDYCEAVLLGVPTKTEAGADCSRTQFRDATVFQLWRQYRAPSTPQSAHSTYPILQSVSNDLRAALQEQITSGGNDLMLPRQYARLRAARA